MSSVITHVQDGFEAVVFGNGWLALAGLSAVVLLTVAVRLSRGIEV